VAELPYQLHVDHPEELELWPEASDGGLLIIYDAPPRREPTLARSRGTVNLTLLLALAGV
jgi:hypothetical protein